ncbi:leucine-rich repeat protein [Ruminococcus albus]|uniref:Transglutaminase domain-containing protein n=1 Tax=Ruminococcus albus (strain ATCC 27210 / DSM 20455 / JCM 14654 / NCDO 2250 / 7) TaxID=697329 RepID=E6UK08_RUMA7|nr:leucine-rich repeat protein [Ruminococcus albus]ADU24004.1 transglutaminase domain-containing protein [Ruminococcus albus 7 = DSM 20455]
MNINIKSKRIIAGVMALSIVSSGAIASESSVIGRLILLNSLSASAGTVYGDWEYEVTGDHTAKLVKYTGSDAEISIPQGIDGHSITELGENLFSNNTNIKSVKIPRGIQSIPGYCFSNASNLESVVMPLGVTKIERGAFMNAKSLTSIALPLSVDTIESSAFTGSGITSINMRDVNEFGKRIFTDCKNLKDVVLPDGITIIPESTFENCIGIESIILPDDLITIEKNAFKGCTNLTEINAPDSLTTIKNSAFMNCSKLKKTPCSESTVSIEFAAFRNCTGLESVSFSNSPTSIGSYAFAGCEKLEYISIPDSVEKIDSDAFSECKGIRSIDLDVNSATKFGGYCFKGCSSVENINVSDFDILAGLFDKRTFSGCKELRTINNESPVILNGDNTEPEFTEKYRSVIIENFDAIDDSELGFFNDYLEAEVKYVVSTNITDDMSDMEKIKTLHDWLCNKVFYKYIKKNSKYTPDTSNYTQVDSSAFIRNSTVCAGYAKALTLLLNESGVEAYLLVNFSEHAWCMVRVGDHYFHLDATHDDSGSDPNGTIGYDHFLISDTDVKKCSSGHSSWAIDAPTSRYKYTIPDEIPKCLYSVGDVNKDGVINDDDADLIWYYCNGDIGSIDLVLADTNFDGKVDWDDYLAALKRKLPRG